MRAARPGCGRLSRMATVSWKAQPDEHDYPAAVAYLSLLAPCSLAEELAHRLRSASVEHHRAQDVLRAAGLPLLAPDDPRVAGDLAKVHGEVPLSPVLLVRGELRTGLPLIVADGYHRLCASYHVDGATDIPCRVVDRPVGFR